MRAITGGIAVALVLLLAGCGSGGGESAAPTGEGGVKKLAVQETAGVPSAFVDFGIKKGFFEKHKLQIDLQPTQGGAATIPALVSGDIQVGGSNVVSLLLASSKDLPIQAIAGGTNAQPAGEKDFGALLTAKGKGISKPEDLEGKTVAVNTLNNIAEVVVKAALEKKGSTQSRSSSPRCRSRRWSRRSPRARSTRRSASSRSSRRACRRATRCSATPTSTPSPTCRSAPTR